MLHLLEVQDFLQKAGRGEIDSSRLDDLIEAFGEDCKKAIRKQFSRNSEYRIRMSGLGRPLCQQQLEKQGLKQDVAYNDVIRFLIGDLVEAAAILVMKAAGVNVQREQGQCSLELDGQTVNGTLDVIIDDKVWDIKSTSPWSFENKFSGRGGYDAIKEDDPFGYISQLSSYVYAAQDDPLVTDKNRGAFLAIDKVNGEICLDVYDFSNELSTKQTEMEAAKELVAGSIPTERISPVPASKSSPNTKLDKACQFCEYKKSCWPNLRMFEYSYGIEYLVHVEKPPKVPEITDG